MKSMSLLYLDSTPASTMYTYHAGPVTKAMREDVWTRDGFNGSSKTW